MGVAVLPATAGPAKAHDDSGASLCLAISHIVPRSLYSYGPRCIFNTVGTGVSKHTVNVSNKDWLDDHRTKLSCSLDLCISRLHVMEVGRTVSLRDEVLPLTIFPDFLAFGYILWCAVVLGLHVRGLLLVAGYLFS